MFPILNTYVQISNTVVLVSTIFLLGCQQNIAPDIETRGIYGNPQPFWDKGINLKDLGANSVFVHSGSISHEMVDRAKSEGMKVFAEFATLNGKNYVEQHPEAWAINEKGEKVEAATWFMGVCPTEPGFRQYRFTQLKNLLQEFDLDGVWMDYVHWHAQFEDPEPILPETCFCDHCLKKFAADTRIQIPEKTKPEMAQWILKEQDQTWRDWRCKVVLEWANEMKAILKDEHPNALLGLYHCPWKDDEYNEASRRILGLDYDLLVDVIDVFSPMVYHGRMERSPEWVADNTAWFSKRLNIQPDNGPKLWPIVQAYNDPKLISNQEFETVLKGGLSGMSSGVMMFTAHAVAVDEGKTNVMKKVYIALDKP